MRAKGRAHPAIRTPLALICHPRFPSVAVGRVEVDVRRSSRILALSFTIAGDLTRVRLPSAGPTRMGTQLWEHTCCEAFIAVDGRNAYHEFNFAPSGEWAAFAFTGYRDGAPLNDVTLAPQIALRTTTARLQLEASVRLESLSPDHVQMPLWLGLAAVVEANDGTLSYWSAWHPAERPDFHRAEARIVRLEPPDDE